MVIGKTSEWIQHNDIEPSIRGPVFEELIEITGERFECKHCEDYFAVDRDHGRFKSLQADDLLEDQDGDTWKLAVACPTCGLRHEYDEWDEQLVDK